MSRFVFCFLMICLLIEIVINELIIICFNSRNDSLTDPCYIFLTPFRHTQRAYTLLS